MGSKAVDTVADALMPLTLHSGQASSADLGHWNCRAQSQSGAIMDLESGFSTGSSLARPGQNVGRKAIWDRYLKYFNGLCGRSGGEGVRLFLLVTVCIIW